MGEGHPLAVRKLKNVRLKGFSLAEIMVAIAILSLGGILMGTGLRVLQNFQRQWLFLSLHRDSQVAIYQMGKEIRNSESIVAVSSGSFSLRAFNLKHSYDVKDF